MALGLSELIGKKAGVQSLFLDENLGLLDEESLGVVMKSLENLSRTGKTVGVVSHLSSLQKRIYTRIQLEKRMDEYGTSRIRVG